MTHSVPLRELAGRRLDLGQAGTWPEDLAWIPVSATELHLAARSFPLAVRESDDGPRLGLLVGSAYLAQPLRSASGAWRGGYQPIGLRCFPLSASGATGDPLAGLTIDADAPCLSETDGLPIVDEAGRPTRPIVELHRLATLLAGSVDVFAPVLDHLMIAGLLAPLPATEPPDQNRFLVADARAFDRLDGPALGAMARVSYLSVDVAMAGLFSLQALRPDRRPQAARADGAEAPAQTARAFDVPFDDLALALDDGELVPFG